MEEKKEKKREKKKKKKERRRNRRRRRGRRRRRNERNFFLPPSRWQLSNTKCDSLPPKSQKLADVVVQWITGAHEQNKDPLFMME